MEAVKQALCAVIERARPEMFTAYSAIRDAVEVHEAREQVDVNIRLLTHMHGAIIREVDIQIARMHEMISIDPDIQHLPHWMGDMSIGGGAWNRDAARNDQIGAARNDQIGAARNDQIARDAARNDQIARDAARNDQIARDAARNDQIARDAQYAAELGGEELARDAGYAGHDGVLQEGGECPMCLSVPAQCVLPCGHRLCFECIARLVKATPVVDGEQHVPCPFCRRTFSNEDDVQGIHDFRGRVYAQLPKQGMLAMQRLLLKL
jgi:hypothetical protein